MQELQLLHDKLDALLKKHATLQAENKRLKATIAEQQQAINSITDKATLLEQNMLAMQMAGAGTIGNGKEKVAMRRQLDNVINEIDKILNTLDD